MKGAQEAPCHRPKLFTQVLKKIHFKRKWGSLRKPSAALGKGFLENHVNLFSERCLKSLHVPLGNLIPPPSNSIKSDAH